MCIRTVGEFSRAAGNIYYVGVTERAVARMASSLLPEMAGNIPITLLKTGVPVRAGKPSKASAISSIRGTGKLARVRVENKS